MRFSTARAMLISVLEDIQISQLHEIEGRIKRCLQNHEAMRIFGISSIRESHGIPDDLKAMERHRVRIDAEMDKHGLEEKARNRYRQILKSQGLPVQDYDTVCLMETNPELVHHFDTLVVDRRGNIVWSYEGGTRTRGAQLLDAVDRASGE